MIDNPIKVKYDVLDENGFKTYDANGNVIQRELDIKYDPGDRNFSYTVNQVARNEFAKIRAAAGENKEIADAKVTLNINGSDVEKTIAQWIAAPNGINYYAEFTNKFKDAMVEQKTKFENSTEYYQAQAYKNGIGDSGGKK